MFIEQVFKKLKNSLTFTIMMFIVPMNFCCDIHQCKTTYVKHCPEEFTDKQLTISEIDDALQIIADGIVQKDAKKIFSIFNEKDTPHYIRDGHIYPDIKTAEREYAKSFSYSGDTIPRKFRFTEKHYDILNRSSVLFTGTGIIESEVKTGNTQPWKIAYTIFWIKEDDGWKAVNMHISWGDK
jgi:ketosteroid isomerase-like protein